MREKFKLLKKKNLFTILLTTTFISIILGILFVAILGSENQKLVQESLDNFFTGIKTEKIVYFKAIISTLTTNGLFTIFLWCLGASILGIPILLLILISKSFVLGFSISSILTNYGVKGILLGSIYSLPQLIYLFFIFYLVYYGIRFSSRLFGYLFLGRDISKIVEVKRYTKVFFISLIGIVIASFLEVYLVPTLFKLL